MDTKRVIKSQYHAALSMLEGAILQCSDDLWLSETYRHPYWWVAYHALFYTDFYLEETEERFVPREKHISEFEGLDAPADPQTFKAAQLPPGLSAYARSDLLEYVERVRIKIDTVVDELDLKAPSGFYWLTINKLELQFYNICHLQHHAAQLIERIRENLDANVAWVGWDKRGNF